MIQKQFCHRCISFERSKIKWRAFLLIQDICVRATLEQNPHNLRIAARHRALQNGDAASKCGVARNRVYVCAASGKKLDRLFVPKKRSKLKRHKAIVRERLNRAGVAVLLCAWVLWGIGFAGVEQITLALGGFEARQECEQERELRQAKGSAEPKVIFTCLPDTVDPRAERRK